MRRLPLAVILLSALAAVLTAGAADTIIDFRALDKAELDLTLRGRSALLVFPEGARVTVSSPGMALYLVRAPGFEATEEGYSRPGDKGPFDVRLDAAAGKLTFLTADSGAPLPEVPDSVKGPVDFRFIHSEELSRWIRYNRVEGLYLGLDFDSRRFSPDPYSVQLNAGYAIGQHIVQYNAGVSFNLRAIFRWPGDFFLAHGKKIESEDGWIVSENENSLQMLLFGYDYRDYFLNSYNRAEGRLEPFRNLHLTGSLNSASYLALGTVEKYYLLGSDTLSVRWNPWVLERIDRFVTAELRFDNAGESFPKTGLDASLKGEFSGGQIRSAFTYRKAVADVRAYQGLSSRTEIMGRCYAGEIVSRTGNQDIALQKLFDFSGPGTVRGLPFREDGNFVDKNRILTLNAEIRHLGAFTRGIGPACVGRFLPEMIFALFADAGRAWNTGDYGHSNAGFNNPLPEIDPGRFFKTLGFGLSDPRERVRVELTRTYYRDFPAPWDRATVRFGRTF